MKGDRNMATTLYIDILEQALKNIFLKVEYTEDVANIHKDDVVLVITLYAARNIIKHNFNQSIIYWFQGVAPEEIVFGVKHPTFRTSIRKLYFSIWEYLVLKKSKYNVFVSDAMMEHYRNKYNFRKSNFFIIPCYNQNFEESAFFLPHKYENTSFVYAGGILKWQCVEEMIQLYNLVKKRIPEAILTILTGDKENAEQLVKKHNAENVQIKYVPVEKLNDELSKHKYGLLLRTNDIVNNVATPTKFNSYLALGVIPIISDVIKSYRPIVNNMRYVIRNKDEKDISSAYNQIINFEKQQIDPQSILEEYRDIFNNYYNTEKYIKELTISLKKYL